MTHPIRQPIENSNLENQNDTNETDNSITALVSEILTQIIDQNASSEIDLLAKELKKYQNGFSSDIEKIKNLRQIGNVLLTLNKEDLSHVFYKKTAEICAKEIQNNPSPDAYLEMGFVCDKLGRGDECRDYYKTLYYKLPGFEQNEDAPSICIKIGKYETEENRGFWYRRAIEIVDSYHSDTRGFFQKAVALLNLGDINEASNCIAQTKQAIETDPESNFQMDIRKLETFIQQSQSL